MCVYINIPLYLFSVSVFSSLSSTLSFSSSSPDLHLFSNSPDLHPISSPLSFSSLNYFQFLSFNLFSSFPLSSFLHGLFLLVSVRSLFFWKTPKDSLHNHRLNCLHRYHHNSFDCCFRSLHIRHHHNSFHCCWCSLHSLH